MVTSYKKKLIGQFSWALYINFIFLELSASKVKKTDPAHFVVEHRVEIKTIYSGLQTFEAVKTSIL
jgi:hypothetical protein